jgi:hypothetical protein
VEERNARIEAEKREKERLEREAEVLKASDELMEKIGEFFNALDMFDVSITTPWSAPEEPVEGITNDAATDDAAAVEDTATPEPGPEPEPESEPAPVEQAPDSPPSPSSTGAVVYDHTYTAETDVVEMPTGTLNSDVEISGPGLDEQSSDSDNDQQPVEAGSDIGEVEEASDGGLNSSQESEAPPTCSSGPMGDELHPAGAQMQQESTESVTEVPTNQQ